jgi:hypothetical protein
VLKTGDDPNRMDYELSSIVPSDRDKPYDVRDIITRVADIGSFLEIQSQWAPNIVVDMPGFLQGNFDTSCLDHVLPRMNSALLEMERFAVAAAVASKIALRSPPVQSESSTSKSSWRSFARAKAVAQEWRDGW